MKPVDFSTKIALKLWKPEHLGFLSFSLLIWDTFLLDSSSYLFGKAYWTTISPNKTRHVRTKFLRRSKAFNLDKGMELTESHFFQLDDLLE